MLRTTMGPAKYVLLVLWCHVQYTRYANPVRIYGLELGKLVLLEKLSRGGRARCHGRGKMLLAQVSNLEPADGPRGLRSRSELLSVQ